MIIREYIRDAPELPVLGELLADMISGSPGRACSAIRDLRILLDIAEQGYLPVLAADHTRAEVSRITGRSAWWLTRHGYYG